jgi:hypothetical protein
MNKRYFVLGASIVLALSLAVPALGGPGNPIANTSASAKKLAKKALAAADAAQQSANKAQNTADDALSKANAAQTTANTANTKADAAKAAADAAQATADAAQASANQAFKSTHFADGNVNGPSTTSPKLSGAACPGNEESTGGGWNASGAASNDTSATINSEYLDGWLVQLAENDGVPAGDAWTLTSNATCAAR